MKSYILRRFIQAVLLLVVILIVNFILLRLTPGDPYTTARYLSLQPIRGHLHPTPKDLQELDDLKQRLGIYLDPWPDAFSRWISGMLHFDFGNSVLTGQSFTPMLLNAALSSFWLLLFAALLGASLGIGLGLYSAYHRGTRRDKAIQLFCFICIALPGWAMISVVNYLNTQLWLATNKTFSFLPTFTNADEYKRLDKNLLAFTQNFETVFFLAALLTALFWSQVRSQTLDVLNEDYVRTAQAKGLRSRKIVLSHVLRNTLSPIISILGGLLPLVLTAQILIETNAGWEGLASLLLSAAHGRDYTVLMAIFTLLAFVCVVCSFLADIAYVLIDPRVREKIK